MASPNLTSVPEPKKLKNQSGLRTRQPCGFFAPAVSLRLQKRSRFMSGVGEYKTRKGNMSGPSLVGFLAPDA